MTLVTRIFLATLAVLVGIFAVVTFYNRNPLEKKWTYQGRYTILDPNTFTITSFPADRSSIVIILLPHDTYVTVPDGYGTYKIDDIAALGKSENKGDELLLRSISYLMGIPIEALSNKLSYWEMYTIWQLKQDKEIITFTIDLSEYPITLSETRSDGSEIELIDPAKIDFYLEDTFWERAIRDDNLSIGIYNASDAPGIATHVSRVLESVGFRVVEVSNWEKDVKDQCEIHVANDETIVNSASLERLKHMLSCDVVEGVDPSGRFDVQIIVTHAI